MSVAYVWRPTGSNRRLAMSDELAQDEEEAEYYDLEAMQIRGEQAKREAMMAIDDMGRGAASPDEGRIALPQDNDRDVVFEIGDEGSDEEREDGSIANRKSGERRGLIAQERRESRDQ